MLKAIVLDFDGLIIDTEVMIYEIYKEWFKNNLNYNLTIDEHVVCVGANSDALLKFLKDNHNLKINKEKFEKETIDSTLEVIDTLQLKPGVKKLIETAKALNLKIFLATSSKLEKPYKQLNRLGIYDDFDFLVTADDVKQVKPHPDIYLKVIEKSKMKASELLVFEDSANGLIAANKANIKTVVITNKVTEQSEFKDYYKKYKTLEDFDLKEIVKEWNDENDIVS